MALEPWCMRPWEIAKLTDYQIDTLYRLPQMKRIKQMESEVGASREHSSEPSLPHADRNSQEDVAKGIKEVISRGEAPSRGQMVMLYTMYGYSKEAANALYDEQLAEWEASKGTKP